MPRLLALFLACFPALRAQPEIAPDRHVTFRLLAPKASEVTLSGEFLKANAPLHKDDKGLWSITVGPVEPEIYNYIFIVDGVRTIDPSNPSVKTGSTASTIASILDVPGEGPRFFDGQPVPHGEIHTHWYHSKSLNALRRLTVYTPPGYAKQAQTRFPVLYLFHGANADETAWTRFGRVNLILDNLLAAGKAKPFVVVMPFGYGVPPGTPRPAGAVRTDNTALFSRDLIEDVIPLVEATYRVNADRTQRAIAGLSMGGEQSLSIGLNHPELFAWVAGFSAALRPDSFGTTFDKLETAGTQLKLLWIGCGTDDGLFPAAKSFSAYLDQHHVKHVFHQSPGAHTWIVWRPYLNELAPLLFR
jgi:enterochelin esterase-like enzyme